MYDTVFVLVEAYNKLLRKKPDQFRSNSLMRRGSPQSSNSSTLNGYGSGNNNSNNNNRPLDCNTSKGWVTPWEHGDKISRFIRKVSECQKYKYKRDTM